MMLLRIGKVIWCDVVVLWVCVYVEANDEKAREYWDYEALSVQWGEQDEYEVV